MKVQKTGEEKFAEVFSALRKWIQNETDVKSLEAVRDFLEYVELPAEIDERLEELEPLSEKNEDEYIQQQEENHDDNVQRVRIALKNLKSA